MPISGPGCSPESVTRIAQQGEALGYDYLTLTDHVVLPNLRVPGYPYSESGEFFGEGPERRYEQLTAAAYVAAKTARIRIVLAVMVVPHRPAVLAAKMLSTIDVLSGGRLVVGIGAGWLEAEFDAVVGPAFAARGRVTDEYIAAFPGLWTQETPRFRWGLGRVRQYLVRAQTTAETAPADLGWRRERAVAAPCPPFR
ncbi:MAG: LLM class flavin-dependent oxidoreductase [Alphaproteobacteria bacterium]|nr:LLM class flavin-dependent oxidoreductase [Alphaproteobacteria bacterium]